MRISAFTTLAFGFGLGLAGTQLVACSDSSDDCNATATCPGGNAGSAGSGNAGKSGGGASNEGGADGGGSTSGGTQGSSGTKNGGGEGGGGSGCTGDVADDAACWTTNELGVFVSSDIGDDAAGDGTREKPFASITKGVASAAGKNVYVCLGAADFYEEKLSIDGDADGVHIYGGFECDNWSYSTTRFAGVQSPEPIALRIASLKKGVQIENMRFIAASGTAADKSSFGAFITESQGVVLRRVDITAGDGAKGADGDPGTKGPDGSVAGAAQVGQIAACGGTPEDGVPGKWTAQVCGSKGGNGGGGVVDAEGINGGSGTPSADVAPPAVTNRGLGATVVGDDGGDGTKGSKGNPGTLGLVASAFGTFTSTGFAPANGKAGGDGFPGQGGGGGGGSRGSATCRGASGGAGGMGGCGGTAGGAGLGGGGSVGLFSWNSGVTIEASIIKSSAGGAGGGGGFGGDRGQGAQGASGGVGVSAIGDAGRGGVGGDGGDGGSGSGGTGGPSYAIAYSGTKPSYTAADTMLTAGDGGNAGVGGQVLDAKAPDGSDGDSQAELEVP